MIAYSLTASSVKGGLELQDLGLEDKKSYCKHAKKIYLLDGRLPLDY